MTILLLVSMLSTVGAQRFSRLPPCPGSCVVCSEEAVICRHLAHIVDAPDSTRALLLTEGSISTVPPSSLSDLSNITLIGLSHNRLSALAERSFRNLSSLQTLQLDHNLLTSQALQGGALAHLAQLEVLALGNNQISVMNASWLEGSRALRTLQLEGNLITRLDSGSFPQNELRNLETLDLSDNLIQHLAPDSFRGLAGLRSLDLSRNRLSSAPAESFSYLSWLTSLNLDLNTWNCSCQLLELSAFLSNFIQQPDKVLYNGRKMVCVSAENPAITTVLELTEANCVPSNQNITVQVEAGASVTPQLYARDLAITAVVCFGGGVGLTLLIVLIYHQVSGRKKRRDQKTERPKEEVESTVDNHMVHHQDGSGRRRDLTSPADGSQPWHGEGDVWDLKTPNGDHLRSRMEGEGGGAFRCPDCGTEGLQEEYQEHRNRRDDGMGGGMETEMERQWTRRMMMMMEEEEEEGRRRSGARHHQFNHQVALNRDTAVNGGKMLLNGSSSYYLPIQREKISQGILRANITPAYNLERGVYRTDLEEKSRVGYESLSCENCRETYDHTPAGHTDRQGRMYGNTTDSPPWSGYPSEHRLSSRGGGWNYNQFDPERNDGQRRETRSVTFDLESSGRQKRGDVPTEHRQEGGRIERGRHRRERGSDGGVADEFGRHKPRVQSSKLLKVKLNLNPVRKSKVHPRRTERSKTQERSSDTETRAKGSKEKRLEGKTRGDEKGNGDSHPKNRQSRKTGKKSKTAKTKRSTEGNAEEQVKDAVEGGKGSKISSKENTLTAETQQVYHESSEGDNHPNTGDNATAHADQSEPNRVAGDSENVVQLGLPIDQTNMQGPGVQYHGNGSLVQSGQLSIQPAFPLSASDGNHNANLGIASSSLTGSNMSLQGGNLLSSLVPTANAMLSINTTSTIAPNLAYAGLGPLNHNTASNGNLESQSSGRQGGLGPNTSAAPVLASTVHTNPLLGSVMKTSSIYTSQSAGLASNLASNPDINSVPMRPLSQTLKRPSTTSLGPTADQPQEPGVHSGEMLHKLAPQPSVALSMENLPLLSKAQDPPGNDGPPSMAHPAARPATEEHLAINVLARSGSVASLAVAGGSVGAEPAAVESAAVMTGGGVSVSHGPAGGVPTAGTLESEVPPVGSGAGGGEAGSPGATLLQQEYLSEEGGSSPRRKLRLVLPEKTSSRPPTSLERKIR